MKIRIPKYYRDETYWLGARLMTVIKFQKDGEYSCHYDSKNTVHEMISNTELSYYYMSEDEIKYRKRLYDFARTHKEVTYKQMIPGKEYLALEIYLDYSATLETPPGEIPIQIFYFEYNHKEKYEII